MAKTKTKRAPKGTVGLDLDSAYLAAVQTSGGHVDKAVSVDLAPGLVTDGEVADVGGLADAIKAFFKAEGLPRRVRLGLSNQQIVVRHMELPPVADPQELAAAVRFQAAEAIAMPLDEAVLDWQVVGSGVSDDGSPTMRLVVVAARSSMIDRVIEVARAAGLRAEGIDLNAFALIRALSDPGIVDDSAKVYCHLGGTTNLAVAQGTTCLFTRPLSTSWEEEGDHVASALAEEIRLSIDYSMSQSETPFISEVRLSGPGATRPGLADELSGPIGLPVIISDPLGSRSVDSLPPGEDMYRYTVATGLALGATA